MRILKWVAKAAGLVLGLGVVVAFISVAVNYRPGVVMGRQVEAGRVEALDGSQVRIADYAGKVVLVSFATNA